MRWSVTSDIKKFKIVEEIDNTFDLCIIGSDTLWNLEDTDSSGSIKSIIFRQVELLDKCMVLGLVCAMVLQEEYILMKQDLVFFNRKEKSVTRATVMRSFHQARTIQESEGCVSGPKKLGTFGASYLYPVFLRIGVCSKKSEIF